MPCIENVESFLDSSSLEMLSKARRWIPSWHLEQSGKHFNVFRFVCVRQWLYKSETLPSLCGKRMRSPGWKARQVKHRLLLEQQELDQREAPRQERLNSLRRRTLA
jgi:hypothetical protein